MSKPDADKALGCLTGLAVCEALAELSGTTPPVTVPLESGLWGDGTSMTLALAESLAECGGVDERDQMVRLTSWFRYGYQSSGETCDRIDDTVKAAIMRFERTWNPIDEDLTQGDACLARVAPTAIFFAGATEAALDACARATRITHSGRQSVDACRLLAAMLDEALTGADKQRVLRPQPPADLCPEAASLCGTAPAPGEHPACRALAAAVNAFAGSESFAYGCALCLPHGPRAMAAYGQLAGAWYGFEAIPAAWRRSLARVELLQKAAESLQKS
ncbi:ADP-ribosylglycohydrolase family protein [Desulfomicrobium salsuginis]